MKTKRTGQSAFLNLCIFLGLPVFSAGVVLASLTTAIPQATKTARHDKRARREIIKHGRMKILFFVVVLVCLGSAVVPADAQVNVTQFHNHESRDGLYIDSAFTQEAAVNLTRDLNFDGTIVGNVYAQPLYIEGGPSGKAMIIVATESNNVYALDALDGSIIWQLNVGDPISADDLICTKLDPLGITGTPIVDLGSRALFLDAMITPDGGTTKKHLILSLNVDTGDINPGWPVDVEATATYNGILFDAPIQMQRPALGIVGNILYVGYGSMMDCSPFHGWLVGVPIDNPVSVTAWAAATDTHGGAIWGVGGIASDGKNPFVITGNTFSPPDWQGGEAVIRFQPGPIFSGSPADYWVPENWQSLDNVDADLGSSGPLLVDVPDATPSHLVVALGKDRNAYLVNRDNLGGISAPIAVSQVASSTILQAAVTYRAKQDTYVAFRANNDGNTVLSAVRITATSPPSIASGWDATRGAGGCGSPFVTSTDGTNNMIVWVVGTEDHLTAGDQRLHAYDGDTGDVIYDGGGPNELMAGTHYYSTTGIVARGRIYVAGDNKVYAFAVPTARPTPTPRPRPTPAPRP
jgi:outer membrane protein assembly factor BamB